MSELLNTAVELMLLGMGMVFVFLTLLIMATKTMSLILMKLQSEPEAEVLSSVAIAPISAGVEHDARLRKVLTEAIRQHRSQH